MAFVKNNVTPCNQFERGRLAVHGGDDCRL